MSLLTKCWAIQGKIKKLFYKIYFKNRIDMPKSVTFRYRLSLIIEDDAVVTIGERTFFNNDCSINARKKIVIGEDCLFGEGVKIYDHNHRFREKNNAIASQGFTCKEIIIGNNCWFGSNVIILKGAKIGNHCVIAAGNVINYEIPENSIVNTRGEIISMGGV